MDINNRFKKGISPIKILPLGFFAIICIGTALLMLPSASNVKTTLFEAFFTATSASCVTGLVIADTGTRFTVFGQAIILALIQLGGLGFMTAASLLFILLRHRVSLKQRMTLAEGLGEDRLQGVMRLALSAVKLTFVCEAAGAILLALRFVPQFGFPLGLWRAVFTSISAFCNAGFDIMGNYVSLMHYADDAYVCTVVMLLIIVGGLGFAVIADLRSKRYFRYFSLHTKLVLCGTIALIFGGALLFFLLEYSNPATLGSLGTGGKALAALFQSVTCRTAGFNTIDQLSLNDASKLLSCVLMFIGGSPAGTAGGIKVTTMITLLLTVRAFATGRPDAEAFGRRLRPLAARRALCMFLAAFSCIIIAVMALSLLQKDAPFIDLLFEAASALGTVGLSTGVTTYASTASRAVLCLLMYTGRVGLLTLTLSLTRIKPSALRYPEGNIMIG